MKRWPGLIIILAFCHSLNGLQNPEDVRMWREFVQTLEQGDFPPEKVRPYYPNLKQPMLRFLKQIGEKTKWEEWVNPEIHSVGNKRHYVVHLTFDEGESDFCFSLTLDGKDWYFLHMEAIFIRLDRIGALPTSNFPDVDQRTKHWMRAEGYWFKQIKIFNLLTELKGRESALNWFID